MAKRECSGDATAAEVGSKPLLVFSHLGVDFSPTFTHQIFPTELYYEDRPIIRIELSPSCQACFLSILHDSDDQQTREEKRRKACRDDEMSATTAELPNKPDPIKIQETWEGCASLNSSKARGPPAFELQNMMEKFLPKYLLSGSFLKEEYLTAPPGQIHSTYERNGQTFCISVCEGQECASFHSSVQKLAYYFIETAEDVDVGSNEASWKCLYLCRKHEEDKFSFAGYMTLFHFSSPFRKPKSGTVLRVCQALVLPSLQRAGHGKAMLHAVFATADTTVVEINCEDPAPEFQQLRLVVDYERFLEQGRVWFSQSENTTISPQDDGFFSPINDSTAQQLTTKALTTAKQIQMVFELDVLCRLEEYLSTASELSNRTDLEKSYRLMVKQRLRRQHQEEIDAHSDKAERQKHLGQLYDDLYQSYKVILAKRRR